MTTDSVLSPRQAGAGSQPSVLVVGSLMMDLVIRAPRRPRPGETLFGDDFGMFLGGKGFNQAVAARRLGANVRMIGRVGDDDFGRQIRAALEREGIDARHVGIDPDVGTGVAAPLIEPSGENSIVSVPRANMRLTPAYVEMAQTVFDGARITLLQLEVPVDASLTAARLARQAGALVLLNTAPAGDVPPELLGFADIVVANESEAAMLTGVQVSDLAGAFVAAERLRSGGATAIVTLGAGGVVVDGSEYRGHVPAHDVTALDTTGAGDAFCGAFAVRLAETGDLRDAVRWANAAGACAVTVAGAEPSLPRRPAVEALLGVL